MCVPVCVCMCNCVCVHVCMCVCVRTDHGPAQLWANKTATLTSAWAHASSLSLSLSPSLPLSLRFARFSRFAFNGQIAIKMSKACTKGESEKVQILCGAKFFSSIFVGSFLFEVFISFWRFCLCLCTSTITIRTHFKMHNTRQHTAVGRWGGVGFEPAKLPTAAHGGVCVIFCRTQILSNWRSQWGSYNSNNNKRC